jgi:mannose-6-phosphate isomerase
MNIMSLLKLTPHLVPKIWGSYRISKIKGVSEKKIGESWELSSLKEGQSKIFNTPFSDFVSKNPEQFLGPSKNLDYMLKYLDTSDNLSVQVHPDDEYAQKHENSLGKSECWFVLESDSDSYIYLGFKPGVTKNIFKKALENKEDISAYLNKIKVKPGDFFFNPSKTVHAIGKDILLAQVQQSCGITYRVWDWNRVDDQGKARDLHIKKGLDVLNFNELENKINFFKYQNYDLSVEDNLIEELIKYEHFNISLITVSKDSNKTLKINGMSNRFKAITIIRGEGELSLARDNNFKFKKYDTFGLASNIDQDLEIKNLSYESIKILLIF